MLSTLIRETLKANPLKRKDGSKKPRHVIFFEEAHNLIGPKAEKEAGENANPKIAATAFVVKMLAEVRALNEAIIIADQLPTAMAPEVIKNTSLKLGHRMTSQDDRQLLGSTMSADEVQLERMATFTTGRTLCIYEGLLKPFELQMEQWSKVNGVVHDELYDSPSDDKLYGKTCEEVYDRAQAASRAVADAIFRKNNPTVREYCEKWLKMKSATVRPNTLEGYRKAMERHIIAPIGDRYIDEITADDLKMLMVPVSKMSKGLYGTVNMLLKCVFYSAVESDVIKDNPAACINPRGGKAKKEKVALTDKQIGTLLDTIKDLPPYLFVMLGLYAGLRREESLGLQWDCVHIDEDIPYISVRRAWRSVKNRPEVTTLLKTPAAKRDIPIPQLLADCLKAEKEKSSSDYVISDSNGEPLSDSQFCRLWHYITVRRVKERKIYRYINGEKIHHTISPKLGERCRTDKSIYYTLDFNVTPHLLRHTYITNLIHEGVDPKTVQYLAGHENSKVTMDIYAKVKYNKPWELAAVVNEAFQPSTEYRENPAS